MPLVTDRLKGRNHQPAVTVERAKTVKPGRLASRLIREPEDLPDDPGSVIGDSSAGTAVSC